MGGTNSGKIFLNVLCSEAAIDSGHKAGEIVRSILQKAEEMVEANLILPLVEVKTMVS